MSAEIEGSGVNTLLSISKAPAVNLVILIWLLGTRRCSPCGLGHRHIPNCNFESDSAQNGLMDQNGYNRTSILLHSPQFQLYPLRSW